MLDVDIIPFNFKRREFKRQSRLRAVKLQVLQVFSAQRSRKLFVHGWELYSYTLQLLWMANHMYLQRQSAREVSVGVLFVPVELVRKNIRNTIVVLQMLHFAHMFSGQ